MAYVGSGPGSALFTATGGEATPPLAIQITPNAALANARQTLIGITSIATADAPNQPAEALTHSPLADEQFLLLLDTLPYPAFVIAAGSQAVHYNRQFVEYVGFYPGPGRADRTALHHPDDHAVLEAARNVGVASDTEYVVDAKQASLACRTDGNVGLSLAFAG